MSDDKEIIRGSGNVFRDRHHPDADGERLRALPAARDHRVPDQCKLTMHAARDETGVAAFPVGRGSIGTVISLREDVAPMFGRLSPLGSQIMTLLADGKPWRGKHIIERVANGLKPWAVRAELDVLRDAGRINRPRFGVWIMAGMPDPPVSAIPPLRTEFTDSRLDRMVLARLSQPVSGPTLVGELGTSRQRVDQMLKKLLARGKVKRVPEPGTIRRWLWMRSEIEAAGFLLNHIPKQREGGESILNCLEPNAFHWVRYVAVAAGLSLATTRRQTHQLKTQGLVATMLFGNKVHVSITPRGLDHPARSGLGPKAARSDLSKSFGERRRGILETLAVLGEARTMEITAALAGMDRPASGLMSGQLIARLVARGFVEACPGDPRVRLSYRLTEAGRSATALIARFRTSPGRARVDERIAAYWAQRTIRREIGLRLRSRSKDLVASPCQQAVLDALADGPRSTRALQDALGDRIRNKRSVHLMLRTLEKRGAVKQKGKEGMMKVWCLRSANDDASAGPAVPDVEAAAQRPPAE